MSAALDPKIILERLNEANARIAHLDKCVTEYDRLLSQFTVAHERDQKTIQEYRTFVPALLHQVGPKVTIMIEDAVKLFDGAKFGIKQEFQGETYIAEAELLLEDKTKLAAEM